MVSVLRREAGNRMRWTVEESKRLRAQTTDGLVMQERNGEDVELVYRDGLIAERPKQEYGWCILGRGL